MDTACPPITKLPTQHAAIRITCQFLAHELITYSTCRYYDVVNSIRWAFTHHNGDLRCPEWCNCCTRPTAGRPAHNCIPAASLRQCHSFTTRLFSSDAATVSSRNGRISSFSGRSSSLVTGNATVHRLSSRCPSSSRMQPG